MDAAQSHCFGELRAIVTLAALDLDELIHQRPGAAIQERRDSRTLRIESETRATLLLGADPEIADVLTGSHVVHSQRPLR